MKLEHAHKKSIRVTTLRQSILAAVKLAGIVSLALLAPNVSGLAAKAITQQERRKLRSAVMRLKDKGLVTISEAGVQLTAEGQHYLDLHMIEFKTPKKWDKKWRIVIFDIPEQKRLQRERLRDMLKRIGFYRVQNSVWVSPYDCEELIALIKTEFHVGKEVLYIIADQLEGAHKLRQHFGI